MWRDNTMDVTASVLGKLSLLALAGVGDALGGIGIGAHSCLLGSGAACTGPLGTFWSGSTTPWPSSPVSVRGSLRPPLLQYRVVHGVERENGQEMGGWAWFSLKLTRADQVETIEG